MSETKSDNGEVDSSEESSLILPSLKAYLAAVCSAIFNVPVDAVEAQLESAESIQCLLQFIAKADIMVLFVFKLEPEREGGIGM